MGLLLVPYSFVWSGLYSEPSFSQRKGNKAKEFSGFGA